MSPPDSGALHVEMKSDILIAEPDGDDMDPIWSLDCHAPKYPKEVEWSVSMDENKHIYTLVPDVGILAK